MMSMNHLATVLSDQNKYDEAAKILRHVTHLREQVLGNKHPSTLGSIHCLACVLASQSLLVQAAILFEKLYLSELSD
jgi:hypothetical protein